MRAFKLPIVKARLPRATILRQKEKRERKADVNHHWLFRCRSLLPFAARFRWVAESFGNQLTPLLSRWSLTSYKKKENSMLDYSDAAKKKKGPLPSVAFACRTIPHLGMQCRILFSFFFLDLASFALSCSFSVIRQCRVHNGLDVHVCSLAFLR